MGVFMRLQRTQCKKKVSCFIVQVRGDYSGIPAMSPRFLTDNELHQSNHSLVYQDGYGNAHYAGLWSPRVDKFYKSAHPDDPRLQKECVLVLDAVCTRVLAENNIFERARTIRGGYKRFTTIAVSGGGRIEVVLHNGKRYDKDSIWELVDGAVAAYDSDDEETLNPKPYTLHPKL